MQRAVTLRSGRGIIPVLLSAAAATGLRTSATASMLANSPRGRTWAETFHATIQL